MVYNEFLLYLSVSTRGVISGQFCGPYFTVRPAKFEGVLSRAPDEPQRYNEYVTNLVFSVRTVSYGSSFFFSLIYDPNAHKSMGKNSVRNLQHGPRTRLVRGM